MVRIGDGEGRFLPYGPQAADQQAADQQTADQQTTDQQAANQQAADQARVQCDPWWGGVLADPAQSAALSAGLQVAIAEADVLGIPPMTRLAAEFGWPTAFCPADCRGLRAIFDQLARHKPGGLLASCNLHADLERWDLYGRMLADCNAVSVVACHDLSAVLAQKFRLSIRAFYQIPGEYRYRRRFPDQTAAPGDVLIYPDAFEAVMARLDPDPGEVHLVAAGFLGKLMCHRIRAKGGIAIDIGSQADRWANQATRGFFNLG